MKVKCELGRGKHAVSSVVVPSYIPECVDMVICYPLRSAEKFSVTKRPLRRSVCEYATMHAG